MESDVEVVSLSGRWDNTTIDRLSFVGEVGYKPERKLVVDLSHLAYLSEIGVATLTFLAYHNGKMNPNVAFIKPTVTQVLGKLERMGIDSIIAFHESQREAVEAVCAVQPA